MKKIFIAIALCAHVAFAVDGAGQAAGNAKEFEAAVASLKFAVAFINPVLTEKALKKLESMGAQVPVLPFIQGVETFVASNRLGGKVACWLYGGLALLAVGCSAALLTTGVNARTGLDPDGILHWPRNGFSIETTRVVNAHTASRTTCHYEPLGCLRDQVGDACAAAAAGGVCALFVWTLGPAMKSEDARAREVVGQLLASPAMIVGDDQDKVAAILKKLGIVFFCAPTDTGAKSDLRA